MEALATKTVSIALLPAGWVIMNELLACLSVAGRRVAAATPPCGGGGGKAVEWREGMHGRLDTGAMAPPST